MKNMELGDYRGR